MKFIVIGITDNPSPWFPPEVLQIISQGKVFSGGKRHHEIVAPLLPKDAVWIDITAPLDAVFEQYKTLPQPFPVRDGSGHAEGENLSSPLLCREGQGGGSLIVFASGDQTITAEIREKIPDCEVAVVKTALSPYFARSVHPTVAQARIYEGARRGIAARRRIAPFRIPGPPYKIAASDRDPSILIREPMEGDDLFRLVHEYLNTFPWNDFGTQSVFNKAVDLSPYSKK